MLYLYYIVFDANIYRILYGHGLRSETLLVFSSGGYDSSRVPNDVSARTTWSLVVGEKIRDLSGVRGFKGRGGGECTLRRAER